jgi:TatD DNase family protein
MYLSTHRPEHLPALGEWIAREQPLAVGECGLDFFVEGLDAQAQQHYFDGQLALAHEFDLPVIVHARRAVDAVIASFKRIGKLRGVVHSFSGSPEQARQLWQLGFMIGIGGPATYERANRLRGLVASMPLDYLLLETDAPDQPDADIRGQRNEPGRLGVICDTIARLRGVSTEVVAQATSRNAKQLFNLP